MRPNQGPSPEITTVHGVGGVYEQIRVLCRKGKRRKSREPNGFGEDEHEHRRHPRQTAAAQALE